MSAPPRLLLSGNQAIARAARDAGVALGAGYPGTPSTEILEEFGAMGGQARWSPNEKVALEVALGAAFGGARALATMKHVGLNVASDVLFTAAYTGVSGALVIVTADDPGMASSQNEQDNRRYAPFAAVPMLEPADSQDAYDFTLAAIEISEKWRIPVLLRVTTRVCHTQAAVVPRPPAAPPRPPSFERDIRGRVMIPLHARPAHRRLRAKLAEIAEWNESSPLNRVLPGEGEFGIVAAGVCAMHAREAAPGAPILKLGMTWPLPLRKVREFARGVKRLWVVEENDPVFAEAFRAEGIACEAKPESERFGELDVARVRALLAGTPAAPAPAPAAPRAPGKAPQLCEGCPYRVVFQAFRKLDCIVSGDIGCYTLGVLPPFEAMDMMVDMGAAIGMGLGLRHVLPEDQARRVVSVIGDSTFIHSGLTGLAEMVYNRPATGHVVVILDNLTTAMTGHQEHPGTGRTLEHGKAGRVVLEDAARGLGVPHVEVVDPLRGDFEGALRAALDRRDLTVIVARRACLLIAAKLRQYEAADQEAPCQAP